MLLSYKAVELDPASRQRTGREHALAAETRQGAIEELLGLLQVGAAAARIDPSRTLIQVASQLWTIVGASASPPLDESPSQRRAGAKHRRVR